ncbi:hypothetical protein [Vulcanisaeta distributa]|nr:hypothetical protein [Vulcanisaeta distributa]
MVIDDASIGGVLGPGLINRLDGGDSGLGIGLGLHGGSIDCLGGAVPC